MASVVAVELKQYQLRQVPSGAVPKTSHTDCIPELILWYVLNAYMTASAVPLTSSQPRCRSMQSRL